MGTNYHLRKNVCSHCNRSDYQHIGKSSGGWCFALRVYPEQGINNLDDWRVLMLDARNQIYDEYNRPVSYQEMIDVITKRKWVREGGKKAPPGYRTWLDFLDQNHADDGPKGLLRHRLDGERCIAHGEGTWDCIVGEFS